MLTVLLPLCAVASGPTNCAEARFVTTRSNLANVLIFHADIFSRHLGAVVPYTSSPHPT